MAVNLRQQWEKTQTATLPADNSGNINLRAKWEAENKRAARSDQVKSILADMVKSGQASNNPIDLSTPETTANPDENPSLFRQIGKQLMKPVGVAAEGLQTTGNTVGALITPAFSDKISAGQGVKMAGKELAKGAVNIKDIVMGNKETSFSDKLKENIDSINKATGQKESLLDRVNKLAVGTTADFVLDPLNKVKILELTAKGLKAEKTGKLALSAAEQAQKGERALLQFGKVNIAPKIGNKVLESTTKLNDLLRATKVGDKGATVLSNISSKIRPGGVARGEFKIISDAVQTAKNTSGYKTDKAIQLATDVEKELRKRKVSDFNRSQLLHAIEKGDKKLAPSELEDIFDIGNKFKNTNSAEWEKLGGSVIEGHGLSHVATKEVADQSRKQALKGGKLISSFTPQDIHRQWVKVAENIPIKPQIGADAGHPFIDFMKKEKWGYVPSSTNKTSKIVNLADEKIKYVPDLIEKGKGGFVDKSGKIVDVKQATAQEINNFLVGQGKKPIFDEKLPTVLAKMGISTGKKKAGVDFLKATKGVASDAGKQIVNKNYEKISNIEAVNKVIKGFDKTQGLWKAQALVSPSYHIRNIAGNIWNNYLGGVNPLEYFNRKKNIPKKYINEMEKLGVLGEGQYSKEVAQTINDRITGGNWKPWSSGNKVLKGNQKIGSVIEDNARIAHYLSKRKAGYSAEQAAKSVKKYLFDYGDLTGFEKNVAKRIMPFYTWTSKNIPLQVEQLFKNPSKFANVHKLIKAIEGRTPKPDERFMSDYLKSNEPVRLRKNKDGNTEYFNLGQWLPYTSAIDAVDSPKDTAVQMATPFLKTPYEQASGKSTYFKNSLGEPSPIKGQGEFLGKMMDNKNINLLKNVRVLNDINKWIDKKDATAPKDTATVKLLNTLFGKTSTYDVNKSKYFYERDTRDKIIELRSAIRDASKKNYKDRAAKLQNELDAFIAKRKLD